MSLWKFRDRRRRAFVATFDNPEGRQVLAFLKQFCRATQPTFQLDDPGGRKTALAEGRREVWLMIQSYLHMTDADIHHLKEEITDG